MMRTETILRESQYDYDELFDIDDPDFDSDKRKSNSDVPLVNSNSSRVTVQQQQDNSPSCLTCGVNWAADHVSLDCDECGGFALRRPCPLCGGRCRQLWRRDVMLSHSVRKAQWFGQCGFRSNS